MRGGRLIAEKTIACFNASGRHDFRIYCPTGKHIFLKPKVTQTAAREYGFDLQYKSKPSWEVYSSLLEFAELIKRDLKGLKPRDMMDIQSFIWVQGSSEYD